MSKYPLSYLLIFTLDHKDQNYVEMMKKKKDKVIIQNHFTTKNTVIV